MNKYRYCALLLMLIGMPLLSHAAVTPVNKVLDALHQNASEANADDYFSLFSEDAVFIGTDANEVWSVAEFKNYAMPHFTKGSGWTYIPYNRHVYLSENGQTAWFDELLKNEKLGTTRGTGVLIKQGDEWKIAQYHLAIPIPNAIATEVAGQIRALNEEGG